MLEKAVEEIKVIQDDTGSTIAIDDELFQEVVKNEAIPNGTISTDELTDEEILNLLEDPVDNPKAINAINNIKKEEVSE